MRLLILAVLIMLLASPVKAWQGDSVNGKLVLRPHLVAQSITELRLVEY
jgi:hypothetical protein